MKYATYLTISITAVFLLSVFTSLPVSAEVNVLQPKGETSQAQGDNDGIRDKVEDVFGDDHVMVDVARCESSFRQFDADGDVLVNEESDAVGIFQLLEDWHETAAENIGLSIYTVEGNIEYAKELYEVDGLKPWSPSSLCWDDGNVEGTWIEGQEESDRSSRTRVIVRPSDVEDSDSNQETNDESDQNSEDSNATDNATQSDVEEIITKRLIIGVDDPEVKRLQQLLNNLGYELAADGPGSEGEETSFFGSLTKQALQEFQCEEDITCSGTEYTTGFGMTGSETRAVLNRRAGDITPTSNRVHIRVRSDAVESESDQEEDGSTNTELQAQIQELTRMIDDLQRQINQ